MIKLADPTCIMEVIPSSDNYHITFYCNLDSSPNNTVSYTLSSKFLNDVFKNNFICTKFDRIKNIELEFGGVKSDKSEVYFALTDFNDDSGRTPKKYEIDVYDTDNCFEKFRSVLTAISADMERRKEDPENVHKFNTVKHKG